MSGLTDKLVEIVSSVPPELATALLAAVPVTELRASLPLGVLVFGLEPLSAFFWSVLGNLIPLVLVLWLFPPFMAWAQKKSPFFSMLIKKYFQYLQLRYKRKYQSYGAGILIVFVAIPLPGSGVWTASLFSVLFGIEKKYAIPAIIAGTICSGFILLGFLQL